MEQDNCRAGGPDLAGWFEVGGDIDDFIFYSETPETSEK